MGECRVRKFPQARLEQWGSHVRKPALEDVENTIPEPVSTLVPHRNSPENPWAAPLSGRLLRAPLRLARLSASSGVAGEVEVKVFRRTLELDARIAYGTDSAVYPYGNNAWQFAGMIRHGAALPVAMQSATIDAGESLGWADRLGSIEPGKLADLVAVRGNRLEDVRVLEHVASS